MKASTLGQHCHFLVHLFIDAAEDAAFPLPDPSSTSFMAVGEGRYASPPDDRWVYALDRRAGRLDPDDAVEQNRRERQKLEEAAVEALPIVRLYDEYAAQAIALACLAGEARITKGNGLQHTGDGYERALRLFGGAKQNFDRRVDPAWELLAWLISPDRLRETALATGAVPGFVRPWLHERGLK